MAWSGTVSIEFLQMNFVRDNAGQALLIRSYESGRVGIKDDIFDCPLIVTPGQAHSWDAVQVETLNLAQFEIALACKPEILLLGTGETRIQPPAPLIADLANNGIGFEIMDNGAACRTYNVLVCEGRAAAVALMR